MPVITPVSKSKLRLLKLERVKDYLLMEEEFVTNQARDRGEGRGRERGKERGVSRGHAPPPEGKGKIGRAHV